MTTYRLEREVVKPGEEFEIPEQAESVTITSWESNLKPTKYRIEYIVPVEDD